jgi:membrane-bound lytic murein transglycosylase A
MGLAGLLFMVMLVAACTAWMDLPEEKPIPSRVIADRPELPLETLDVSGGVDDLDLSSLRAAIAKSLQYYDKLSVASLRFGNREIPVRELKASLKDFLEIVNSSEPQEIKIKTIREHFEFLPPAGRDIPEGVIFTGYYVPLLEGSWVRTERFHYPLYRKPDDLIVINLAKFNGKYKNEQLIGRLEHGEVVPYYTRDEIDRHGALDGRRLELLWVDDPVKLFSLHVQGSGKIRLPDGRVIVVSFAQSNGRPFRSISKALVEQGKIGAQDVSYPRIQQYLRENPSELSDLFGYNDRYIFFRQVEREPVGALGVPVTSGRTIATDRDVFPQGALSLIKTRKPLFDANGQIRQWVPFFRFVLNQDAGAAIKGAGRVDIFCGDDANAERLAGSFKEKGDIYILLSRKDRPERP